MDKNNYIEKFTKDLLDKLNAQADVNVELENEVYMVYITGDELGHLIGYRGENIYALESILSSAAYKELGENSRVRLDIGGYREEREQKLKEMAQRDIEMVKQNKQAYKFAPMKPAERRILHIEISNYPEVISYSIGEDPNRRLVVSLPDGDIE